MAPLPETQSAAEDENVLHPAGSHNYVPAVDREKLSSEELQPVLYALKRRMLDAQDKYKGSYLVTDLRADLEEELLDVAAYAILMILRMRKALPKFEGPTSNQWHDNDA